MRAAFLLMTSAALSAVGTGGPATAISGGRLFPAHSGHSWLSHCGCFPCPCPSRKSPDEGHGGALRLGRDSSIGEGSEACPCWRESRQEWATHTGRGKQKRPAFSVTLCRAPVLLLSECMWLQQLICGLLVASAALEEHASASKHTCSCGHNVHFEEPLASEYRT